MIDAVHNPNLVCVQTGNLVYLQAEARDAKGFVITHLGISQPWNCVVTVTGGTTDDGR